MHELSAADVIRHLDLRPHPEGGHYRETYRAQKGAGGRGWSTAIHFLLQAGERSHWHRIDADEIWHWHAGAMLSLSIADGTAIRSVLLGPDLAAGQRPQAVVPAHAWQAAESNGAWTLVGCTVAPAFRFEHFEMAPPGWSPDGKDDPSRPPKPSGGT